MMRGSSSPTSTSSTYRVSTSGCRHALSTLPTRMSRSPTSSSAVAGAGFLASSTAAAGGGGVVAASDGEIDGDDEQKSATLLVDLAAGGKNEPARFRARMRGDDEEGRKRAQEAYAIPAADIIPDSRLRRWYAVQVVTAVGRTKVLFYLMDGMEQKRRSAHSASRLNSFS
jgi:hypothetical protein